MLTLALVRVRVRTSDGGVHAAEERERAGGAHDLEREPTHRRRAAHLPRVKRTDVMGFHASPAQLDALPLGC